MTGIIDYGVGNLFSLRSSFEAVGETALISGDAAELRAADRLVLPGVGAFGDAAEKLVASGLDGFVREAAADGVPLLGICLGMQLLYEESLEFGRHAGLGLLPGRVAPMAGALPAELKIPQIGWNSLHLVQEECPLFAAINEGEFVYFVHSFYVPAAGDALAASTDYGVPMTAAAAKGNVFGCQFHPEKSGAAGLRILRAFCTVKGARA